MGKKKNVAPINLNSGPLKAVTIGEIKQSKYSWLWIMLMFVLFCGLIFFLPDINKIYQKLTKGSSSPSVIDDVVPNNKSNDDTSEDEDTKYMFTDTTQVEVGDLLFSNIAYNEGNLTLKVTNNSGSSTNIADEKLYFVLYDETGNVLNTVSLKGTVANEGSIDLSYSLKTGAKSFEIKTIEPEDYTYIDIKVDNEGNSLLTCTKENDKLVYTFEGESLAKIEHTNLYANTANDYNELYEQYKEFANKYGTSNGISASLSSDFEGLNYRMTIDYSAFDDAIDYSYYFEKGTSPRIVNFILEADLYNCA